MEMLAIASMVLISGLIDDLRSRKVHNSLLIGLVVGVIAASLYFRGAMGSIPGMGAFVLALGMGLPLFAAGILGGGDVKLFAVFSLAVDPLSSVWTFIYALIWGGLFGVTRALLNGQITVLVRNTYRLGSRQRVVPQELQKIPYTFALLLGWFTQLTLLRVGGML